MCEVILCEVVTSELSARETLGRHSVIVEETFADTGPTEGLWLTVDILKVAILVAEMATGFTVELIIGILSNVSTRRKITDTNIPFVMVCAITTGYGLRKSLGFCRRNVT